MSENIKLLEVSATPTPKSSQSYDVFSCPLNAAMYWYGCGFSVIPIIPGSKKTVVKWDPWLEGLDPQKVYNHWTMYPSHEVGFIVGDDVIVFDTDTIESVTRLYELEARSGLEPQLVVLTTKGQHHYFRRASGTVAKSDAHSSQQNPERIDIKTGRALIILPPSTGKSVIVNNIKSFKDLTEANQNFIDAVFLHNGRTAPSERQVLEDCPRTVTGVGSLSKLESLLSHIDPDCGYEDWFHVGMAIFHETGGSEDGLALFDNWSSRGKKYKGMKDIDTKWRSFRDVSNPVTIGTLRKMAKEAGADVSVIIGDAFVACDYDTENQKSSKSGEPSTTAANENRLDMHSPLGMSDEIEKHVVNEHSISQPSATNDVAHQYFPLRRYYIDDLGHLEKMAREQKLFLGNIAIIGQSTVLYAKQNTGKTLLVLYLIIEAVKAGKFDASRLIYINMDDNAKGLMEKGQLAKEFGFQMVADGINEFEAKAFRQSLLYMIDNDKAQGVIVVLDTLKKFVNAMDKVKATDFARDIRRFIMKGGTIIALSHVNKNPGKDGKVVYAGTTDIIDDFDCGYTLDTVSEDTRHHFKTVLFENIKKRGAVAESAAYTYSTESGISYEELIASVQEVDSEHTGAIRHEAQISSYGEITGIIAQCISDGINTKMMLASEVAKRSKISKRNAIKVIDMFTGVDPAVHRWSFEVKERGSKVFRLLSCPIEQPLGPAMSTP